MPEPPSSLGFKHCGIAEALKQSRLKVPPNQREYSWEEEHVADLFGDLENAKAKDKSTYFLGTIVLTAGTVPEVVDGQQRLATTTILISAIRDYFYEHGRELLYTGIENDFLWTVDRDTESIVARLHLNHDDHEFFLKRVLSRPDNLEERTTPARKESHERIECAARMAAERVKLIVEAATEKNRVSRLNEWLRYLESNAQVILLTVPSNLNAYVMFETLNDRGLRTSQADLVKNYLFGEADDRLNEAQMKWSSMVGVLEVLGIDDVLLVYLRHMTRALHGPTEDKEILEKLQTAVSGTNRALEYLDALQEYSDEYAAILTPTHRKWNSYPSSLRGHVEIMKELRVAQIRPLLLAVARQFSAKECAEAFRQFVTWTVRFLIAGGGRGGTAERAYSLRAQDVVRGKIETADSLQAALDIIPTDGEFTAAFSTARVSTNYLGRYYLRAMESYVRQEDDHPELAPVEDTSILNLEHVLPKNTGDNWSHIDPETASAFAKRIGNMVLLSARDNSITGNAAFAEKKLVFADSQLVLTKQVSEYDEWRPEDINDRQRRLAEIAVKTWPL